MRILFLTLVFAPDGVSTATLMTELASDLVAGGHEVTVLTTVPHYNVDPEARQRQPLRRRWAGLFYESDYQGMHVYHAPVHEKGSRILGRLFDYFRFHCVSTLLGLALRARYDIVFAPSPPLTIGLNGWLLAWLKRVPFLYNVQEIFPDVAIALGVLRHSALIRLFRGVERVTYRSATKVIVISEEFRQDLLRKGVPAHKVVIIPNFVDTTFMRPGPRQNDVARALGLADAFVVLYAGNIGLTQGFETLLAAAHELRQRQDVVFLVVGHGARSNWLTEQVQSRGLMNVRLLPYQPRSAIPALYATADICLVPLKHGMSRGTLPSKIYTIMAAGRPAMVSVDPDSEVATLVRRVGCGWVVKPEDESGLVEALLEAAHDPAECRRRGLLGREYVSRTHSREQIANQYTKLLNELSGCRESAIP